MKNSFDTIIQVFLMITVAATIAAFSSEGTMQFWLAIISVVGLIATMACVITQLVKNN